MRTSYQSVLLDVFQEPVSNAWFYYFVINWVVYRPSHGYPTYRDAKDAGEEHINQVLTEHGVEI